MAESGAAQYRESGERRGPTLLDPAIPAVALIALLALSYLFFGDDASAGPNQVALLFCAIIAAAIGYKNGMRWDAIRRAAVDGIAAGLPAIMILLAVGALIGTWALCGTIVSMVYYGLKLLSPSYFYATTALVCALIGFSIGSAWTVAGTIGNRAYGCGGKYGTLARDHGRRDHFRRLFRQQNLAAVGHRESGHRDRGIGDL